MVSEQQVLDQIQFLRNAARRLCRNRLDAEDLLQDTLIRCLKFREACHTDAKNWCYTIMRHVWFTQLRRNKHIRSREADWAMRPVDHSPVEEHIYALQMLDRIKLLSPKQRAMLNAWLEFDSSYRDGRYERIALLFGIKLGTVKSRMWRLRETLCEIPN
jgi:RNA polymerase sigma-70 factor (ECF subfamily)